MEKENDYISKISPDEVIRLLGEKGDCIDEKMASEIINSLYFLAKLIVDNNFQINTNENC